MPWLPFIIVIAALLVIIGVLLLRPRTYSSYADSIDEVPVYETRFRADSTSLDSSCYNATGRSTNSFTASNPCVKCTNKHMEQGSLQENSLSVQFPPVAGPSFWTRLGTDGPSSCTTFHAGNASDCCTDNSCCPPLAENLVKGRFEFWVYFPAEDQAKLNQCKVTAGSLGKTYPFYHGGKLLGICSQGCPTGNVANASYGTDWTLRVMFREKGVVALLYSIPDPETTPFSYEPVPLSLQATCCPHGQCDEFFVKDRSADQYWFATRDSDYHGYRLAEYTFNNVSGLNCGVTQQVWPGNIPNPIAPILQAGVWNFLRVRFDVLEGTAQMLHYVDITASPPTTAPDYAPDDNECDLVIDTPAGTIPFTSKQGVKSFYFQPFFGGKSPEWDPACLDSSCNIVPGDCAPAFVFGDVKVFQE